MTQTQENAKQKLSQEIDAAKGKLEALKRDIAQMHEEDKATLRERQAREATKRELFKQKAVAAGRAIKELAHTPPV